MATFDYNPITGNLDLVGSGASYINGVVADPTALPVTVGTPALDSVYLSKAGSGIWLINRRPAGLYCRTANNGNAADWTYLGAFPEVNADGNWELYNTADPTKELKFDLSGLPTATTRTVNAPDGNGKMLVEGQSIGATTRASGAFTTLNANNGTLTASAPVLDLSQTWSASGVTFTGLRLNITDTASAAASNLLEIQVGGVTRVMLKKSGTLHLGQFTNSGFYTPAPAWHGSTAGLMCATNLAVGASLDTILERGGAGILEQRNLANAQTFRLYNTYTDASNYERGFMRWSSNVLQIGTEAGGTGSNRNIQFFIGATASATLSPSGSGLRLNIRDVLAGYGLVANDGVFKNVSGTWLCRNAADSAFAPLECAGLTLNGNLTASTRNIVTDTTTGTKIGTATDQKIGFFNKTPVVQPAAIANGDDSGTVQDSLNALLAAMRSLGLIAT